MLRFVSKRSSFPPLGLLTVAAMLPPDWELRLVDMNVAPLKDDDLRWADYVFLSAMIVHKESVHEIVRRCQRLHKPIIAGGPLFTTGHADFPDIDHFVLGEAEELMPQLVEDLRRGAVQPHLPGPRAAGCDPYADAALGPDRFHGTTSPWPCSSRAAAHSTANSATSSS